MVGIPYEFAGAYQWVANLFQIKPEWLLFPNIITIFLVPLILNVWMFYVVLGKILRIFHSSGVNWIIAGIMGFLMLPFNQITMLVAPLIIGAFGMESTLKKIVMIGGLYAFYFLVLPWLTAFLTTMRF